MSENALLPLPLLPITATNPEFKSISVSNQFSIVFFGFAIFLTFIFAIFNFSFFFALSNAGGIVPTYTLSYLIILTQKFHPAP